MSGTMVSDRRPRLDPPLRQGRLRSIGTYFVVAVFAALVCCLSSTVVAGVIQITDVSMSSGGASLGTDRDEIFRLTSAEITSDIHSQIGGAAGSGFTAAAGAGRFGQIG